ncbi:glycerate 3-kinase [Malassezia cuniculi]|uniref:Glycerate 3-kinase n=1 Tax=Malassezia cuniculi TaxID=948313 RepID=A0AAF0F126_9BASI|nr:glycerate 3-kinase [Malassezia cuniculi]
MSIADAVVAFIEQERQGHGQPLVVALQGAQGCGKSYTAAYVHKHFTARGVHVAVLSLDDLYLPHEELVAVGHANPRNPLLQGRGQPGTHDIALGTRILHSLREQKQGEIELPVYDKSAHRGLGDRAHEVVKVSPPIDVVIFEGWCLGFSPVPDAELAARVAAAGISHDVDIMRPINEKLREWERQWYPLIDAYVKLIPTGGGHSRWDIVHTWRLQAEHAMKAKNGGNGMSDEAVHAFVERYIPTYRLYGESVGAWPGHTLCLSIEADRRLIDIRKL